LKQLWKKIVDFGREMVHKSVIHPFTEQQQTFFLSFLDSLILFFHVEARNNALELKHFGWIDNFGEWNKESSTHLINRVRTFFF